MSATIAFLVVHVQHRRVMHGTAPTLSAEDENDRLAESRSVAPVVLPILRVVALWFHLAHLGQMADTRMKGCSAVGTDLAGWSVAATRKSPHWLHRPLLDIHRLMRFSHSERFRLDCISANSGAMLMISSPEGGRIG